jgi:hypothetical protein
MKALAAQVGCLPDGLWPCLLGLDGGFVVISTEESHYAGGPSTVRRWQLQNVAFVDVVDLAQDNERPLHVLAHLVDHQLGCKGEMEGPWLSEGGGRSERQREAARRIPGLFALGYGPDEIARANVHDYFAQSLALYCRDRRRLNVADPQIEKWLRTNFWNSTFWHGIQD